MNNTIIDDLYINKKQYENNDIDYLKRKIAEKDFEIKELKMKLEKKYKIS